MPIPHNALHKMDAHGAGFLLSVPGAICGAENYGQDARAAVYLYKLVYDGCVTRCGVFVK